VQVTRHQMLDFEQNQAKLVSLAPVAALFCRSDSVYKTLPGVVAFDEQSDARTFSGGMPVVCHPPCRAWGRLRHFSGHLPGERHLATFSLRQVRRNGGVLEHPSGSLLWRKCGLLAPGVVDSYGGFTLPISQHWWGHRAEKKTWLYICGCAPGDVPLMPFLLGSSSHVIQSRKKDSRPHVSKAEREETPLLLALWLVELARLCKPGVHYG
jgi:hypothetical protein